MKTTIGQLLVNDVLPKELQDAKRELTGPGTDELLGEVARKFPEQYKAISHALMQHGREASYREGVSLGLTDMVTPFDRNELLDHVRKQQRVIAASKDMTDDEKQTALAGVYEQVQKFMTDKTYEIGKANENPFAMQVLSKARGSPQQLAAMMTTPGTYTDSEGKLIPVFIRHSYAEGLSSPEYWASTYGARKSIISTKFATQKAGYLGKQFNQAAMRVIVTGDDCETNNGIPVSADDKDNIGAVLARAAGKYPAGTVISKEVMGDINTSGVSKIVVRSPLTCSLGQGVCKYCVGHREDGAFPRLGANVGINASSALAERIAQSGLNTKHSGGMSSGGKKVYSGFDVVESLFQVPETFPDAATVASEAGRVKDITKAPQGGWNVTINDTPHYVLPNMALQVKDGDFVEAGDQLSDGIANPQEIVKHKGLGEGRRYFTERAIQAFRDSGYPAHRRNMELLVRGSMDSAKVDGLDGAGDYLPGDIASYSKLAATYKPRKDSQLLAAPDAIGQYLEQPIMHYTIGTKVTKRVAQELKDFGHDRVMAHPQAPSFEPVMLALRAVPQYEEDWMAQLGSSYLKSNLLDNVHRGAKSDVHGLHPVPGIAQGTEFSTPGPAKRGY